MSCPTSKLRMTVAERRSWITAVVSVERSSSVSPDTV
ncbi:hypothetical protein GGP46_000153 [Salinibacter ruber]|nr:hypothetical protein [Salinibacter ruber]